MPGASRPLARDVLGRDGHHPRLGSENDVALGVLDPAPGAQAVAIQHRARPASIGEGDRGRPVPRLHQAGVEVVEALDVGIEVLARAIGLGDHHHHRVRDRAAAEHQQLQHVVEGGRVRTAAAHDRQHLLQVVAEQLGDQLRLARPHPVDVAAQRVDLAVVGDHPVRMGQLPAGEGVGGEARVHQRQAGGQPGVAQVREVARQLGRGQHPLVDDRAAGEAGDGQLGSALKLDDAADQVQLALELSLVLDLVGGLDDQLADDRRRHAGDLAHEAVVDRHVSPPEGTLALRHDRLLDQLLEGQPALGVPRQVADADAVAPGRRQLDPGDRSADERIGDLQEDPGAVTGVGIGSSAPRCSMFSSASRAFSTTACVASPHSLATSAMPQPSCSYVGS